MKTRAAQPLIIKKYENRRLYNTLTSQYINQEQVAQMVRDGHDVRVIDAANGDDITRLVLAQIVLEDAKTPGSVFPLDVLRQMVVASGKATQESALRYMKAMMDMYQSAYRALPHPLSPFEFMSSSHLQRQGTAAGDSRVAARDARQVEPGAASDSHATEVRELRKRVEELEAMLSERSPKKKRSQAGSRHKT